MLITWKSNFYHQKNNIDREISETFLKQALGLLKMQKLRILCKKLKFSAEIGCAESFEMLSTQIRLEFKPEVPVKKIKCRLGDIVLGVHLTRFF